jgi:hypothetical protein
VAHGLGSLPSQFTLQQCGALSPTPAIQPTVNSPSFGSCTTRVVLGTGGYQDAGATVNPSQISVTSTNFLIPIVNTWWVWGYWTNATGWGCVGDSDASCFTGYYRILAWR